MKKEIFRPVTKKERKKIEKFFVKISKKIEQSEYYKLYEYFKNGK